MSRYDYYGYGYGGGPAQAEVISSKIPRFDYVEYRKKVNETKDPADLYKIWDSVCRHYEMKDIPEYLWEEMRDHIYPRLAKYSKKEVISVPEETEINEEPNFSDNI